VVFGGIVLRRLVATLVAGIGPGAAAAQQHLTIGHCELIVPLGWNQISKSDERIVLRRTDGKQQATISVLEFTKDPTFDEFKRICQHRIEAENKELEDGFIQPEEPSEDHGAYGMLFSGGDRKTGRVFSGYLSLMRKELLTVYVEGLGVTPKENLETFAQFVKGTKRK
jgi:hypothetical protein